MKFTTKAIHAGQAADSATGATITPIYQTSTFTQDEIGVHKGYEYSRSGNPTRRALEECLAALENGKYGMAFASGLAANMGVFSILKPGDSIIACADLYGGSYRIFEKVLKPLGINTAYVEGEDAAAFEAAYDDSVKLVWIESPTNPLLRLIDIESVAKFTKTKGAILVVDNTFATPFAQTPLDLGADIVVHSTTKYIGGHSDSVGGAIVLNDAKLFTPIRFYQNAAGGIPGPFDSWLTLRGVKTLELRMLRHQENAFAVAELLQNHPKIKSVNYPGLASRPQHALAKRQMKNFGGMISFEIDGGKDLANKFIKALKYFSLAESLGGVESLISYPAAMTHASIPREERIKRGVSDSLLRISVGIENKEDLLEDLAQGLQTL